MAIPVYNYTSVYDEPSIPGRPCNLLYKWGHFLTIKACINNYAGQQE